MAKQKRSESDASKRPAKKSRPAAPKAATKGPPQKGASNNEATSDVEVENASESSEEDPEVGLGACGYLNLNNE
jgi:hypothetical protein